MTDEHLVGSRVMVMKARTVKRRPVELKWDKELYKAPEGETAEAAKRNKIVR